MLKLPALQNFTADRMSLVTPPNSNGWTIPLKAENNLSDFSAMLSIDFFKYVKRISWTFNYHPLPYYQSGKWWHMLPLLLCCWYAELLVSWQGSGTQFLYLKLVICQKYVFSFLAERNKQKIHKFAFKIPTQVVYASKILSQLLKTWRS